MAQPRLKTRGITLPTPPWHDLLQNALSGSFPTELRLEDMLDRLEADR